MLSIAILFYSLQQIIFFPIELFSSFFELKELKMISALNLRGISCVLVRKAVHSVLCSPCVIVSQIVSSSVGLPCCSRSARMLAYLMSMTYVITLLTSRRLWDGVEVMPMTRLLVTSTTLVPDDVAGYGRHVKRKLPWSTWGSCNQCKPYDSWWQPDQVLVFKSKFTHENVNNC